MLRTDQILSLKLELIFLGLCQCHHSFCIDLFLLIDDSYVNSI